MGQPPDYPDYIQQDTLRYKTVKTDLKNSNDTSRPKACWFYSLNNTIKTRWGYHKNEQETQELRES